MNHTFNRLINQDNRNPEDYEENGLLMCGKCHAPKQKRQNFTSKNGTVTTRLVPVSCQCMQRTQDEEQAAKEAREFRAYMHQLQEQFQISDGTYQKFVFQNDDSPSTKISTTCRNYVERWPAMKQNNMGILFYGSVGTGKSFYACAIVNALLEQRVSATVTSFPRLLNILQGQRERQACIDHLQSYQMLVIDDLGTERDSSYGAEQIFNVIDARARSELPLIVTTNLALEDLQNAPNMQLARIYDRVLEMCPIRIKMTGESRRAGNAQRRRDMARELLTTGRGKDL